jgi:hypothetical protein
MGGMGRGGMGGGMGGAGMGGAGMGGGGMGGGGRPHRNRGQGGGSGSAGGASLHDKDLSAARAAEVKSSLERAFELLDPTQQDAARKILAAHDVDLDAGSSAAKPTEAPAGGETESTNEP